MKRISCSVAIALIATAAEAATAGAQSRIGIDRMEARLTCKQASSCEEAVIMWCNGYSGADRDRDGIPCENVCHSRAQVAQIQEKIGCALGQ